MKEMVKGQSLRPKHAAEFLGIGESTLWRWHDTRPDFPRMRRLGKRITVVNVDELIAWRDAQGGGTKK